MPEQDSDLQQLQMSVVEFLMAVIAAPDDENVARSADEAIRELDLWMTDSR
ncbi:hypothetical protein MXD59_22720 [Frankia sp. Ag45/Mut15]|uniref:Uncharacterized protein n=1 Tax=Frankia umida TaxID=573489 RepID=A0ABT0K428_9ACTN|nr:hypothetical protein [Frankia umida]MCK9878543.1 hypothetical protein [Frankia umida]